MQEEIKINVIELLQEKKYAAVRNEIEDWNEVDIAEVLEELSADLTVRFLRTIPKDTAAEVFSYMESDVQEKLIELMSDREISEVMGELFVDDAVDLIEEMPANIVSRLLKNTPANMRETINRFLNYPDGTAGSIMTVEFVDLKSYMTVKEAFDRIRATALDKETIYTCYVMDDKRFLKGVVTVHRLLLAKYEDKIEDLMDTNTVFARTSDSRESVALDFKKYGLLAMPVVDASGRLVGIVTVDDAMDVLEEETTEDIEKMAAITPTDKPYLRSSVFEIWKKRIPWLLLLMVSATFTGQIIS